MKNHMKRNLGGFTLIELLVVVLIIGILAAIAVPQYNKAVAKSKFSQAIILGESLANAAERYIMANGEAPATLDVLDIDVPGNVNVNNTNVWSDRYSCSLTMGGENQQLKEVYCSITGLSILYRSIYYPLEHQRHYCQVEEDDSKGNELCKAVGGKNPFSNGSGNNLYYL